MRKGQTALAIAAVAIGLAAGGAEALVGKNGHVAVEVFTVHDVREGIVYPPGFSGVRWDEMSGFTLGTAASVWRSEYEIAENETGDLFFVVVGCSGADRYCHTGLIRYDGLAFHHVIQSTQELGRTFPNGWWGERIDALSVSPVSSGLLTAGQPVLTRVVVPDPDDPRWATEIVAVDHTTSPATEVLVHRTEPAVRGKSVTILGNGDLCYYRAGDGLLGTKGELRRLVFDGSGYDESVLATDLDANIGHVSDGEALYAFPDGTWWGVSGRPVNEILRIDPATGARSVFATVSSKLWFSGWTSDGTGRLWIGVGNPGKNAAVIRELASGDRVDAKNGVTESSPAANLRSLGGGPTGTLHILEWSQELFPDILMWRVEAGSGDGGGGNGNGKGRKK